MSTTTRHLEDVARTDRGMRVLLVVAAGLVFLAGLQLFGFPDRTADWFSWTMQAPMTAVFLGASYWSSAVLEVAGARAGSWREARLSVWTVLVFTVLTLVVTLVHLDLFHLGAHHPASARAVTVGWLAIYVLVPVAMVLLIWRQAGAPGAVVPAERERPPRGLRVLLAVIAAALLGLGVALLLAPLDAAQLWAWPLTELTGRAIGAWLVGLGWAAAHAVVADDLPSMRPLGLTGVTFVVLQGVALLRYGDALAWSTAPAVGYVAGLAVICGASGWILGASPQCRRVDIV